MAEALKTPRTATARPVTTASGRYVRLGTASMLQDPSANGGLFINTARLDLDRYARRPALAKTLFKYILYVTNDTVKALDLAAKATEACGFKDWWWKAMVGVCHYRLGMFREAEKQFLSSLKLQPMTFTAHLLAKVYIRLDQPGNAIEYYTNALSKHANDPSLLAASITPTSLAVFFICETARARIYEGIGQVSKSVHEYKGLLQYDSTNVEAIASLAANHFYGDQPEKALLLYRRLLQMGLGSAELFNNMGLCCFYAQQFDMALGSFERALSMAEDEVMADVWYNLSHVALGLGDIGLSYHCLKLAVSCDPSHAEAFNNLGALEHRKQNFTQASAHYAAAAGVHESHYNAALLAKERGDFQSCFNSATSALETFPEHVDSNEILNQLKRMFLCL